MKKLLVISIVILILVLLNTTSIRLYLTIQAEIEEGYEILSQEDTDTFVTVVIQSDEETKTFVVDKEDFSVVYMNPLVDENFRRCLDND